MFEFGYVIMSSLQALQARGNLRIGQVKVQVVQVFGFLSPVSPSVDGMDLKFQAFGRMII